MADLFVELGGRIILGEEVLSISETHQHVTVELERENITSKYLLACAGLQADRVAPSSG